MNAPAARRPHTLRSLLGYGLIGLYFGTTLAKGEVVSWWRIQEMFRFDGFHMYGVMGTAWLVAVISFRVLARGGRRSMCGDPIALSPKPGTRWMVRYWAGGIVFGLGWALLGACPGPLYVLVGLGLTVYVVAWCSALLGTLVYGHLERWLPH